jgi:hypothetical protein
MSALDGRLPPMAEQVYDPHERPDVEVLVDGTWHPGELRGWWDRDGERLVNVSWRAAVGTTYIDTVRADRVREV